MFTNEIMNNGGKCCHPALVNFENLLGSLTLPGQSINILQEQLPYSAIKITGSI